MVNIDFDLSELKWFDEFILSNQMEYGDKA